MSWVPAFSWRWGTHLCTAGTLPCQGMPFAIPKRVAMVAETNGEETMPTGKVKFFNNDKGFGFITPDNGGTDVFVHVSALRGTTLREGDIVSYDLGEDRKTGKSKAENVAVLG